MKLNAFGVTVVCFTALGMAQRATLAGRGRHCNELSSRSWFVTYYLHSGPGRTHAQIRTHYIRQNSKRSALCVFAP